MIDLSLKAFKLMRTSCAFCQPIKLQLVEFRGEPGNLPTKALSRNNKISDLA